MPIKDLIIQNIRSFTSKMRLKTFEWVAIDNVVLFILSSRLLLYSTGSRVNIVKPTWLGHQRSRPAFLDMSVSACEQRKS